MRFQRNAFVYRLRQCLCSRGQNISPITFICFGVSMSIVRRTNQSQVNRKFDDLLRLWLRQPNENVIIDAITSNDQVNDIQAENQSIPISSVCFVFYQFGFRFFFLFFFFDVIFFAGYRSQTAVGVLVPHLCKCTSTINFHV